LKESTITPKMISRPIAETCQMASCQAPLGRRGVRPAAAGRAKGHAPLRTRDGGVSDRDRVRDPPPPLRTNRTRRVLHPVLIGHAASLSQVTE
jgi:hypothetical protein